MIVGRANDDKDIALNVAAEKKLTNMRAAGSDESFKLARPKSFHLSARSSSSRTTSWSEVTPQSIRLRKRLLNETARLRLRSGKRCPSPRKRPARIRTGKVAAVLFAARERPT